MNPPNISGAGDADGGAATQERRHGEGDRAGGQRHAGRARWRTRRPPRRGSSSPGSVANGPATTSDEEDQRTGDHDDHDVREQLLERDPPRGSAGRGDELEAAPARLSGERAGQREDRPEARRRAGRRCRTCTRGSRPGSRHSPACRPAPGRIGGTAWTRSPISWRDAGVANSDTIAWLTPMKSRPQAGRRRGATARRESRMSWRRRCRSRRCRRGDESGAMRDGRLRVRRRWP